MPKQQVRDERGKVKFRVIEFELDGSDSALQDAIRGLTTALTDRAGARAVQRLAAGTEKATALQPIEPAPDVIEVDSEALAPASAPRQARSPRAFRTPQVLVDLDLTSGPPSLREFLDGKKVDDDSRRYLAIAYWLKTHRRIESVGVDHIYTAYRFVGWNVPKDAAKPLRNMKSRGWFSKGRARGEYAINHVGEGVINARAS